ncbi:UV-endonuclease UvdE [Sporormia fimetaria CBS 119925]|uniref:UV-endonuclease UvdE n=1 Tax=Sporormia fimetaria CBS 119925 TaxID=1340428 RepID=A0A6A6VEM7_9PLEO|nr:UV-endonuclease UvdE [Sporormia fimetaria CBS 119925]
MQAESSPVVGALLQDASAEGPAQVEEAAGVTIDPEADEPPPQDADEEEAEFKEALSRPPPVNSSVLPLPWKGRLGYACLNTYLRSANPPVFSSRTCRIASIIEHRHPLRDPSQPEHATKNRPDREQPASIERGHRYVQELGLANARDIAKMVRWNDKFNIKFMRLSSEMFPFASHLEYGYPLAPFASETLAEVGKVIAELGHRVTTHPGQFTQLGSPRKEVIEAAIRDLEYHDEMLSLLRLPEQQDRDAVMILHLGGVFGDKEATLNRFRTNYARLSDSIKRRLVLENDDVSWSVHELLPLCQELNIPMVLDFHHHNIIFDDTKLREGTHDIISLFPAILETWRRKNITPKMHYSEPCPEAVTKRDRRKHSPRVMTLPPCPADMDLMIEAKDKEQAVFELMRTYKLPGFDTFNDIIPHQRQDENKPWKPPAKKKTPKKKKKKKGVEDVEVEEVEAPKTPPLVPDEELNLGGPDHRVYWPPGMEHWLRPPKRVVKKKEEEEKETTVSLKAKRKRKTTTTTEEQNDAEDEVMETPVKKTAAKKTPAKKKPTVKKEPVLDDTELSDSPLSDFSSSGNENGVAETSVAPTPKRQRSRRKAAASAKYTVDNEDTEMDE